MAKYVSAWTAYTETIGATLEAALKSGQIDINDTVWCGPSGDYVVGDVEDFEDPEDYLDYTDRGTVSEYLHDA